MVKRYISAILPILLFASLTFAKTLTYNALEQINLRELGIPGHKPGTFYSVVYIKDAVSIK